MRDTECKVFLKIRPQGGLGDRLHLAGNTGQHNEHAIVVLKDDTWCRACWIRKKFCSSRHLSLGFGDGVHLAAKLGVTFGKEIKEPLVRIKRAVEYISGYCTGAVVSGRAKPAA
ncbi:hypothetical protein ES703_02066 [subsurface metagenome]